MPRLRYCRSIPRSRCSCSARSPPSRILNYPENASAVAEICARSGWSASRHRAAAARIKVLSPSSMRTRLASRLQLLTGGARDLPQRQQTLRAAMDWSYDLLSSCRAETVPKIVGVRGRMQLEGVEAVCDTKRRSRFGPARRHGIHGGQEPGAAGRAARANRAS